MLPYTDATNAIDERSTERMSFRTKPRIKDAIRKAAALSGVDDSVFTMLDPIDHEAFFAALDRAPASAPKLRAAFARHKARIDSK